jgi:hypothetical protein
MSKNKSNSPKPQGQQNPKPATESNQGRRNVNESFGDQSSANNLEKSFIHTDPTIVKPKR